MSQISTNDSLYLCGSNHKNTTSFLIHFYLQNTDVKTNILVNPVYAHYKPILLLVKENIWLVVRGKSQVLCEKYSLTPLASPNAGAPTLKYGDVNTETTSPGEVKGLISSSIQLFYKIYSSLP